MIELDSNLLVAMAQRLKRWESPRNEGRNDKGKGGSARQRQLKKRTQMLRQKLKDQGKDNNSQGQNKKGENHDSLPFYFDHHWELQFRQETRLLREVGFLLVLSIIRL